MEICSFKSVSNDTLIYCTIDVDGGMAKVTESVSASSPYWNTPAQFSTTNPTPTVMVKLFTSNTTMSNTPCIADIEKLLGVVTIQPSPSSSKVLIRMLVHDN